MSNNLKLYLPEELLLRELTGEADSHQKALAVALYEAIGEYCNEHRIPLQEALGGVAYFLVMLRRKFKVDYGERVPEEEIKEVLQAMIERVNATSIELPEDQDDAADDQRA